jgi:hypothetical protein
MPEAGFEPAITASKRAKTVHVTVTGQLYLTSIILPI